MKSKNSLILLFKCPGPSTLTWHKLPLLCSLPSALQWRGARGRISQNFQVSFQADFFLTFFTKNVPIYWRDIVTILSSHWWRLRELVKSSVVGPCRCWCYRGWAPVLAPAAWLCSSPSASLSSDSATAPPTPRHTWHVSAALSISRDSQHHNVHSRYIVPSVDQLLTGHYAVTRYSFLDPLYHICQQMGRSAKCCSWFSVSEGQYFFGHLPSSSDQ